MQDLQLPVAHPPGLQHLIRDVAGADQAILLPPVVQLRPLKQLQKADLELVRLHRVYRIKRVPEAFHPLIGKARDQIQMQVDVLCRYQRRHHLRNTGKLRPPVHASQGLGICRLHADLHLDQARPQPLQQRQLLPGHPVCFDLKMKIRHPVVVLLQVPPDRHRKIRVRVKGPVDEFYLPDPLVQEKLQLLPYRIQIPPADPPLPAGQAVGTGKRAAPAGFIVQDPVGKQRQIPIKKRDPIHIHRRRKARGNQIALPQKSDPAKTAVGLALGNRGCAFVLSSIICRQSGKSILPLAQHAEIRAVLPKEPFRIIGRLRAAGPQPDAPAPDQTDIPDQPSDPVRIPDIRRKSDHIRILRQDPREHILVPVIDRKLQDRDRQAIDILKLRTGLQTVNRRTGMNKLSVHRHQKDLHEILKTPLKILHIINMHTGSLSPADQLSPAGP